MKVKYIGPDGKEMDTGFKEAYTRLLIEQGYDVVYIGDGMSDIYPARRASHVFAIGDLWQKCRDEGLSCVTFTDFFDVIKGLQELDLG
jgi:2-hydroxy-3-keto-5-methylthiopentenyl-1-phosphate phosphatase